MLRDTKKQPHKNDRLKHHHRQHTCSSKSGAISNSAPASETFHSSSNASKQVYSNRDYQPPRPALSTLPITQRATIGHEAKLFAAPYDATDNCQNTAFQSAFGESERKDEDAPLLQSAGENIAAEIGGKNAKTGHAGNSKGRRRRRMSSMASDDGDINYADMESNPAALRR